MNPWVEELRLLAHVLTEPGTAFLKLRAHAPIGRALVVIGALQAVFVIAQGWLVLPAVLGDPLLRESADPAATIQRHFWIARIVAALCGPGANAVRAAALATLLQGCSALCGVTLSWRALVSLALHLDVVFLVENFCVTALLAAHPPETLEALARLRLHAGLDLVWQPASRSLAQGLEAASLFTLWWAGLAGWALCKWMRGHRRSAVTLGLGLWAGLVGLRWITTPH